MPNIIDTTYFERGNLYIPNNKDYNVEPEGAPTIITDLEASISKYERELLLNALGVTLYDELQVALVDLPGSDQKWTDLVEGRNYTNVDGKVKRWDGLKGYNGQSLIAFYIFTEYLRNDNEEYATVGTVRNTAKNAEVVSATPKFIKAYSQFISFYQGKLSFNEPQVLVNGFGSAGFDWYNESVQVSLYNYLTDCNDLEATSFPDFEFKVYESQNSFGI
jgi:hypothetical protein